jgi:DNA invertase Pin-like site-specific DNA recombinase
MQNRSIVGYIRVSTRRQQDEGLSLENQEYRLRNAGATLILADAESGRKSSRTNYQRLKQMVLDGEVAEVVAIRIDRLGRSLLETVSFVKFLQEHDVKIRILDLPADLSTSAGNLLFQQMASFAEYYSAELAEKQRSVNAYKRTHGIPKHGIFGYKWVQGGLEPDDRLYGDTGFTCWEVAQDVLQIFLECGSQRGTIKRLLEKYGDRRHKSRHDFPRSYIGLRSWLLSPTIRGLVHYPGEGLILPGNHPVLVDPPTDEQIRRLLKRGKDLRGGLRPEKTYPLSGLVYCVCGSKCSIGIGGSKKYPSHYYVCNAHRVSKCDDQPEGVKRRKGIRLDSLEAAVIEALCDKAEEIANRSQQDINRESDRPNPRILEIDAEIEQWQQLTKGKAGSHAKEAIVELQLEKELLLNANTNSDDVKNLEDFIRAAGDREYWLSLERKEKLTLYQWLIEYIEVKANEIALIKLRV